MDFYEKQNFENERIRIERQQKRKHEYKLVGSERKIRGHTLFSFDTETKEIKVAEFKQCDTIDFLTRAPLYKPKVVKEPNCIYLQALNQANCVKKLKQKGYL